MSNTRQILFWSGGFDSTAVLLHLLKTRDVSTTLVICGCNLTNAPCQSEDLEARKAIADILQLTKLVNVQYTEASVTIDAPIGLGGQAQVWAYLASSAVLESVDNILTMGYIKHDDFWHFRPWFENAVTNLIQCSSDNVSITYHYPFEWFEKRALVHHYFDHPDVFGKISWAGDNGECKLKEKAEIQNVLQNYWAHNPSAEHLTSSTTTPVTKQDDEYYI